MTRKQHEPYQKNQVQHNLSPPFGNRHDTQHASNHPKPTRTSLQVSGLASNRKWWLTMIPVSMVLFLYMCPHGGGTRGGGPVAGSIQDKLVLLLRGGRGGQGESHTTTIATSTTTTSSSIPFLSLSVENNNNKNHHNRLCHKAHHWKTHSVLCHMLQHVATHPQAVADVLYHHALEQGLLVGHKWLSEEEEEESHPESTTRFIQHQVPAPLARTRIAGTTAPQQLPVVFAHGMGDSCFNAGMQHVVELVRDLLSTYVVCIPTGATQAEDTNNGYFLSMPANVDIFAQAIQQDAKLQHGFHAIGFSQGNNVIRGYISLYNTPTVHTFLSINGVNAGEGAVPHCRPDDRGRRRLSSSTSLRSNQQQPLTTSSVCELLMEQASRAAYTEFAQEHSFQANYWRDPRPREYVQYQALTPLAVWNNEATAQNPYAVQNQTALFQHWQQTYQYVWVLATQDTMVLPREGEHWAAPNPKDPFGPVIPRTQTAWYQQDLFGLRTAEEAGKNVYLQFEGDHLQFTKEELTNWIQTYLTPSSSSSTTVGMEEEKGPLEEES